MADGRVIEKLIVKWAEDLCGLMRASGLSIGLALAWAPRTKSTVLSVPNDPPYFWVYHMNAFLTLAIASDRLRDLLIVASTGTNTDTFENRGESKKDRMKDHLFVTPFNEAGQILASRGLKTGQLNQAITDLPTDAATLWAYVHRRNVIVHNVATRTARFTHQTLCDLQAKFDEQQRRGFQPRTDGPAEWFPSGESREAELRAEIDLASKELRDWYLLLIRASSNVFQVEYYSRALR